jgi:hypothetical protein
MGWLDKILGREKSGSEAGAGSTGQPSSQPEEAGAPPPPAPSEPSEPEAPAADEPDRI